MKSFDDMNIPEGAEITEVEINKSDSTSLNEQVLASRKISKESIAQQLIGLTEDGNEDNASRFGATETLLEMGGWLKLEEEEVNRDEKIKDVLGLKNTSIYLHNQEMLKELGVDLPYLVDRLIELSGATKYNRQGELVADNGIRLKATKVMAELAKIKSRKKLKNKTSITEALTLRP